MDRGNSDLFLSYTLNTKFVKTYININSNGLWFEINVGVSKSKSYSNPIIIMYNLLCIKLNDYVLFIL